MLKGSAAPCRGIRPAIVEATDGHARSNVVTSVVGMDPGAAWAEAGTRALLADRPAEAGLALRRAVALLPIGLDSLSNLAACAQRLGQDVGASQWLLRLLSISALDVEALVALASVHPEVGVRMRSLRRAATLSPNQAEGWIRTGAAWMDRAALVSLQAFGRALAISALSAAALIGIGLALGRLGRKRESIGALRRGLALAPDRVDGWDAFADPEIVETGNGERLQKAMRAIVLDRYRAAGWHRLGGRHWADGRAAAAGCCYRRALALEPRLVEAVANLGAALRELDQPVGTLRWFYRAVTLAPDSAGAMTNLGTALPPGSTEARRWHYRALLHEPSHVHALNNLGSQDLAWNDIGPAIRWFDRAMSAGYADGEAQWNRGVSRLVSGDLERGFADYEERWTLRAFAGWRRPFLEPVWQGEPGAGRTILVHAEQGLGDTIQFVRYLAPLAAMGFRVVLECQPALVRLMADVSGAARVVAKGDPLPIFDVHVPLLSLAHRLGTRLRTVPARVPYLTVPPRDPRPSGRRIGLVWAGNPQHKNDGNRSLDTKSLRRLVAGLCSTSGITIVPLQVGSRADDIDDVSTDATKIEKPPQLSDFTDTAAVIASLNLVIGVDTSVMHLVGALGRPGWALLPFSPDWRWLLGRSDSPWYPTLRLYRQPAPNDWTSVVEAVLEDLHVD